MIIVFRRPVDIYAKPTSFRSVCDEGWGDPSSLFQLYLCFPFWVDMGCQHPSRIRGKNHTPNLISRSDYGLRLCKQLRSIALRLRGVELTLLCFTGIDLGQAAPSATESLNTTEEDIPSSTRAPDPSVPPQREHANSGTHSHEVVVPSSF